MGSVTNITTRRAPAIDSRYTRTFSAKEEWRASSDAERYLEARGFSHGPQQGGNSIGILLGDSIIPKWTMLSAEDKTDLHGLMEAELGNFRFGPVTVWLRPDAPSSVVEAFNADVEEPGNVVPLHGSEAADAHPVIDPPGVFIDDSEPRHVRITSGRDAAAQSAVEKGRR